jgi:hypothetical protein
VLLPHKRRFLILQDALKVPEWKEAVFEEMKALKKNGTWELIDLPSRMQMGVYTQV